MPLHRPAKALLAPAGEPAPATVLCCAVQVVCVERVLFLSGMYASEVMEIIGAYKEAGAFVSMRRRGEGKEECPAPGRCSRRRAAPRCGAVSGRWRPVCGLTRAAGIHAGLPDTAFAAAVPNNWERELKALVEGEPARALPVRRSAPCHAAAAGRPAQRRICSGALLAGRAAVLARTRALFHAAPQPFRRTTVPGKRGRRSRSSGGSRRPRRAGTQGAAAAASRARPAANAALRRQLHTCVHVGLRQAVIQG